MAKFFGSNPLEVRKEILHLESKEFGDHKYHSNSEIGGSNLKWVPDLGMFSKRILLAPLYKTTFSDGNAIHHGNL